MQAPQARQQQVGQTGNGNGGVCCSGVSFANILPPVQNGSEIHGAPFFFFFYENFNFFLCPPPPPSCSPCLSALVALHVQRTQETGSEIYDGFYGAFLGCAAGLCGADGRVRGAAELNLRCGPQASSRPVSAITYAYVAAAVQQNARQVDQVRA